MANHLTPTEINDRLDAIAEKPPSVETFGFDLMEAVGAPAAAITRARSDATAGCFTWSSLLRYEASVDGDTDIMLDKLKQEISGLRKSQKPRLLVTYNGVNLSAYDTKILDTRSIYIDHLRHEADFFFPLGGIERCIYDKDQIADVYATKCVSRLYDAIRDHNKNLEDENHKQELNIFMIRLLFCLFAEDIGIFSPKAFSSALENLTKSDGSDLQEFLTRAFRHMNTHPDDAGENNRAFSKLPYVNGGIFEAPSNVPSLNGRCRRYLVDCIKLEWSSINPDIFGSMMQAVVDSELRAELGMHYTSPSNIKKVLGPILINELEVKLEQAGDNKNKLNDLLKRLKGIRIFDPACGSGNFLIIAFKELRRIELEIQRRLGLQSLPTVSLDQFYGIEIDDFACNTARLGLYVAEYQENEQYRLAIGDAPPPLPLHDSGKIFCGNATRIDWKKVCPPDPNAETIVVGNPPFKGTRNGRNDTQKSDIEEVFSGHIRGAKRLDYVAAWFLKATLYSEETGVPFAFVATNSIVSGRSVDLLWKRLLKKLEILFAYRSFPWKNLAARKAAAQCVIVGLGPRTKNKKKIFDGDTVRLVDYIGPYLVPSVPTIVSGKRKSPLSEDLQHMKFGNMTLCSSLIICREKMERILENSPAAEKFIRPAVCSDELLRGVDSWCIWVREPDLEEAMSIPDLVECFEEIKKERSKGGEDARKLVSKPWSFREQNESHSHTIVIPITQSSNREWIPAQVFLADVIPYDAVCAIYDGPPWQASILSCRMHRLWLETVGGRRGTSLRYSITLVWNTFPLPKISDQRREMLNEHWWEIDLARKEAGLDLKLEQLYDRKKMPAHLREAHEELDRTVDIIFGSRKYRSDVDRVAHLLSEYDQLLVDERGNGEEQWLI